MRGCKINLPFVRSLRGPEGLPDGLKFACYRDWWVELPPTPEESFDILLRPRCGIRYRLLSMESEDSRQRAVAKSQRPLTGPAYFM